MKKTFCKQLKIRERLLMTLFILLGIILLTPLIITFTNSLMGKNEVQKHYELSKVTMQLIPDEITLQAYKNLLFTRPQYLIYFWNSVKVTLSVIIGQLVVSTLAAYGFTTAQFKTKRILFWIYILIMLLPTQVVLVPSYMVIQKLNLIDHHLALILPGIFSPFGTFLLTEYMKEIPNEYVEAAKIDGANAFQVLQEIIMPILRPGLFAVMLLTFIEYWNLVEQPLVFIKDTFKKPLSIYLSHIGEEPSMVFAASCFYMFPVLWAFLYGQDNLIQGLELSGIKG